MHQTLTLSPDVKVSPYVVSLREELRDGSLKRLGRFPVGDLDAEVCQGRDSVWCLIRREGRGGLALRTAYVQGASFTCRKVAPEADEALRIEVTSMLGTHRVCFRTTGSDLHRLHAKTTFTPAAPMRLPYLPHDLYPLDENDDPTRAKGNVEAAQRGVNSGLVYFRFDEPDFGSVLYFQNLTSLNPYFEATGTKPDSVVGGQWPELGYLPPTPENQDVDQPGELPANQETTLSDAYIVLRDWAGNSEQEMGRQFVQMLSVAYQGLDHPAVEYRDWVGRAQRTLTDLKRAPQARCRQYGNLYVMPYPDGEYPDVMVQLSVIAALNDWGKWTGKPDPLQAELMKGVARFYDPQAKTLRRYLPNVGEKQGKDPDSVDSWYLFHPMFNLGRLALDGNEEARELLLKSIDYGIEAAHHFKYVWPVMYKIQDFSIITKVRGDGEYGQTDVNGLYAYVMVQCFELTGEKRFLDEARKAIDVGKGLRFDLLYQANLTTWGAAACMRLWRITADKDYLEQSYAYLAAFFHNCQIWESDIGHAKFFSNFLGATCLHDSPYMAMYECFECFAGLDEYLQDAGPDLDPAVRMMISEYCKYTLHRAWFYYPDALPKEAIQQGDHQSGVINLNLNFPLEDLYADGSPNGKVGQEIYGSGAAFIFATRSHHDVENAPFRLFCNQFVRASERTGERAVSIQLDGGETCSADISLIRLPRRKLTKASIATAGGDAIRPRATSEDRIDYRVPASGRLILTWE